MTGYDGNGYDIGDRVELHPGSDLWMRGARYGTVTHVSTRGIVFVKVDKTRRSVAGNADSFRRIPEGA